MGRADYLKLGDSNGICDRCGFKYKLSELRMQWDNLRTCPYCWDYRHPQEFLRGIPDTENPPADARPESTDIYSGVVPTSTPVVPASGVSTVNTTQRPLIIQIWGGVVASIFLDGVNQQQTSGIFTLQPNDSIVINYSQVPSWSWQSYS